MTAVEEIVASVFADLLGVDRVVSMMISLLWVVIR